MELQSVLYPAMVQRNRKIGTPVFGTPSAECEKPGLEERTALIAALKFLRGDVEPSDLLPQAFDQYVRISAVANGCSFQFLCESRGTRRSDLCFTFFGK